LGTVQEFAEEPDRYELLFHILPQCVYDVILGKSFLKATRTLSNLANFARRMKKRVLKGLSKHRLFYLGDSAPNFTGLVNGRRSDALGDSGSNVLVMDEDHARSLGLQILTEKAHRSRLIFVDSSMAYTSGLTKSVRWQFDFSGNRHGHFLDFHVLENAPAEVILSDSFLFETEAFSQYECYMLDDEDKDFDADANFFTISYDPSYRNRGKIFP
jgi:hypothetical protein